MQKRLVSAFVLIAYTGILLRLVVFKTQPLLETRRLKIKFGYSSTGQANVLPFKTILRYLHGDPRWSIAIINLVGNVILFVPIGFLVPFVFREITWQKSLALAAGIGLAMEGMEAVFRVGIFDIDDVILNASGVMIGYWIFAVFVKRRRSSLKSS